MFLIHSMVITMTGDYEKFKILKKKVAEALNISEERLDEMIKEKIMEFG